MYNLHVKRAAACLKKQPKRWTCVLFVS